MDSALTMCRKKRIRVCLIVRKVQVKIIIYERNILDKYVTYIVLKVKRIGVKIKVSGSEIICKDYIPLTNLVLKQVKKVLIFFPQ